MSKETELILNDIINKTNQLHDEDFNLNSEKMVLFVGTLLAIVSLFAITIHQTQTFWIVFLEITLGEVFFLIGYSLFKYYIDAHCGLSHRIFYYLNNINKDIIIIKKSINNNTCDKEILMFYLFKFFEDFEYISINNKSVKKALNDLTDGNGTLFFEYSLYKDNISYFKKFKKQTN